MLTTKKTFLAIILIALLTALNSNSQCKKVNMKDAKAVMVKMTQLIKYPEIAQNHGYNGKVFVKCKFDSKGKISEATVEKVETINHPEGLPKKTLKKIIKALKKETLRVANEVTKNEASKVFDSEFTVPIIYKLK